MQWEIKVVGQTTNKQMNAQPSTTPEDCAFQLPKLSLTILQKGKYGPIFDAYFKQVYLLKEYTLAAPWPCSSHRCRQCLVLLSKLVFGLIHRHITYPISTYVSPVSMW